MTLESRFNLGDKVYFPWADTVMITESTPCPICGGTGKVVINGTEFDCPNSGCHEGMLITYKTPPLEPKLTHICKVTIDAIKDNISVSYQFNATGGPGSGSIWYESECGKTWFDNLDDCQKYCDNQNKKSTSYKVK